MIRKSAGGRPAPALKRVKPAAPGARDRVLALHRAVGNSGAARLMRNGKVDEIEMQELRPTVNLLHRLGEEIHSPFPSFQCWRIGSTLVYVYWRALERRYLYAQDIRNQITQFAQRGFPLYRGLPIWHGAFREAADNGRLVPFEGGNAEPDFITRGTNFLPMSVDLGTARVAALASSGASQGEKGPSASVADVKGFREDDPEQVLGLVAAVAVTPAAGVDLVVFNPGEFQLGAPVNCKIAQVLKKKDVL